jgi:predicted phage tail protein
MAFDNAGNSKVNNNNGGYFTYNVSTSTSLTSISTLTYILVAVGVAAAIGAVAFMILKAPHTKSKRAKPSSTQDQNWNQSGSN